AGVPQRRFHEPAGDAAAAHLGRHFGVVDGKDVALAPVLDEGFTAVLAEHEAPAGTVMADFAVVHHFFRSQVSDYRACPGRGGPGCRCCPAWPAAGSRRRAAPPPLPRPPRTDSRRVRSRRGFRRAAATAAVAGRARAWLRAACGCSPAPVRG